MAIGSAPEVGTIFKSCQDYTMADWDAWWQWMRENWHPNLLAGYATIVTYEQIIKGEQQ